MLQSVGLEFDESGYLDWEDSRLRSVVSDAKLFDRSAEHLRNSLGQWKEHEVWADFQPSWEKFCEEELGKSALWVDLVIAGEVDFDVEEMQSSMTRATKKLDDLIESVKQSEWQIGENRGRPFSLTNDQVSEVLSLITRGVSQVKIAKKFCISQGLVSQIKKNPEHYLEKDDAKRPQVKQQGTSQEYLLFKIKREDPTMLDKIGPEKEFKSVYAAARHLAVLSNLSIGRKDTGLEIFRKLYDYLSEDQLNELYAAMSECLG